MLEISKIRNTDLDYLTYLLSTSEHDEEIFATADEIRRKYVGEEVYLRAIIEFSNVCTQNCLYCGLRAQNSSVKRYRMSVQDIIKQAEFIAKLGTIGTVVLQSGEDPHYDTETVTEIILRIKSLGLAITLSLGERTFEEYRVWKDAGADRYLLKHETASPQLYALLHPGDSLENRKAHLWELKRLGYETGTGCMVGLPGQTPYDLALDLAFFRELDADMIGIGPFIPHPNTPLGHSRGGDVRTTLKMVALTRIILPDANIPATTALGSIDTDGRLLALKCGANVIMPNLTPNVYRDKYEIYPGKSSFYDTDLEAVEKALKTIEKAGLRLGKGPGGRKRAMVSV